MIGKVIALKAGNSQIGCITFEMFRKLLISAVLISQILWLIRPVLPYVEYVLNYEYISEVLCINQDKPELECDGKCYLRKQVIEQVDPEPTSKGVLPLAPQWDLFATTLTSNIKAPVTPFFSDGVLSHPMDEKVFSQWIGLPPTPPPRMS